MKTFEPEDLIVPKILIPENILKTLTIGFNDLELIEQNNLHIPKYEEKPYPKKPDNFKLFKTPKSYSRLKEGAWVELAIPIFLLIFPIYGEIRSEDKFDWEIVLFLNLPVSLGYYIYGLITNRFFITYNYDEVNKVEIDKIEYQKLFQEYENQFKTISRINESNHLKFKKEEEDFYLNFKKIKNNLEENFFYKSLKPLNVVFTKYGTPSTEKKYVFFLLHKLILEKNLKVYTEVTILHKHHYNPDILIICKKTGFNICIETHRNHDSLNENYIHTVTSDKERIYLENNIGVIKFTEQQIFQERTECVELIKNVFNSISYNNIQFKHKIDIEKKWTYEKELEKWILIQLGASPLFQINF